MAATVTKLATKTDRLRRDRAQLVLDEVHQLGVMGRLSLDEVRSIGRALAPIIASHSQWKFMMISPAQVDAVIDYLNEHSRRPLIAIRLWGKCIANVPDDTHEIMLSRDEFAAVLNCHPNRVSAVTAELERIGAISRRRERGRVRYFLNPNVGTHLAGEARDQAQAKAPKLELVV